MRLLGDTNIKGVDYIDKDICKDIYKDAKGYNKGKFKKLGQKYEVSYESISLSYRSNGNFKVFKSLVNSRKK